VLASVWGSFGDVASHFGDLDLRFVALALALQLTVVALRALAWRNVLAAAYPQERVGYWGIGASYAAGMALNAFVPARGGDAAKIVLARSRIPGATLTTVAASTAVLAVADAAVTATLVTMLWATGVIPALPAPPGVLQAALAHPLPAVGAVVSVGAAGWIATSRLGPRLRRLGGQLRQGGAVLRSPRRYLHTVVAVQLVAWTCRIGVVASLLAAFGLPATAQNAALVVVMGGLSTLVPVTPGGVGTQQAMVTYALRETATAAGALSFSVGLQAGITVVNTALGVAALMLLFRTTRPLQALRAGVGAARKP
jgi:hypothetical protein